MKPLEAWYIISGCMNELANIRAGICGKGYSDEEVTAQVIAFEALRRMQEEGEERRNDKG
jgi:hypothetical protein